MELTKELCEIIGAYMGDGCIYKTKDKHYVIQYSGDAILDKEYYECFVGPIISKLFGVKTCIKNVKGKNAIRVNFYSKDFYYFLKDFFNLRSNKKSDTIFIPETIFKNKNNLHSIIRGLFDTDGGIFLDKRRIYRVPYPRIIFHTTSKKLHNQLIKYLSKHFKIYSYQRKYKNPKMRDSFSIEIYGQKQLNRWTDLIGFSNPRHLSKLPR